MSGSFGDDQIEGLLQFIDNADECATWFQDYRDDFLRDFGCIDEELENEEIIKKIKCQSCWSQRPPRVPTLETRKDNSKTRGETERAAREKG